MNITDKDREEFENFKAELNEYRAYKAEVEKRRVESNKERGATEEAKRHGRLIADLLKANRAEARHILTKAGGAMLVTLGAASVLAILVGDIVAIRESTRE